MFKVEYAQKLNGKFHGWVEGGLFQTREAAEANRVARCIPAADYVVSEAVWDSECEEWV